MKMKKEKKSGSEPSSRHHSVPVKDPSTYGKTLNNRSSMKHNIITGEINLYAGELNPGLLDTAHSNKKLGITQLRDLAGPNAINRNPDYV